MQQSMNVSFAFIQRASTRLDIHAFILVIIKDYVGGIDRVTAAQYRGLSCEIEAKRTSHNKMAPKP